MWPDCTLEASEHMLGLKPNLLPNSSTNRKNYQDLHLLTLDVPPGFLIPLISQDWQKLHKKPEIFK